VLSERLKASEALQKQTNEAVSKARSDLTTTLQLVKSQNRGGFTLDWFPPLTILESMAGPLLFGDSLAGEAVDVWSGRVARVREMLAKADAERHGADFESLLWRDALAFWALRSGDYPSAQTALDTNDPHWEPLLRPDDSWRLMRAGMHACADIQRLAAASKAGTLSSEQHDTAVRAADTLRRAIDTLDDDAHRRAMRILFQMNLRLACKDLLDLPKEAAELRRRLIQAEAVGAANTEVPALPAAPASPAPATR